MSGRDDECAAENFGCPVFRMSSFFRILGCPGFLKCPFSGYHDFLELPDLPGTSENFGCPAFSGYHNFPNFRVPPKFSNVQKNGFRLIKACPIRALLEINTYKYKCLGGLCYLAGFEVIQTPRNPICKRPNLHYLMQFRISKICRLCKFPPSTPDGKNT